MALKELATGAIITIIIGGGAYTIKQADVVDNFAADTGMTHQQAEQYVNGVKVEDLVAYDDIGGDYIKDGNQLLDNTAGIDCDNYHYDWESATLSCQQGKLQLTELGNNEISLGNSYKQLGAESASKTDIASTVSMIDRMNASYGTEIVGKLMDNATISENMKANSYNKATLQAALESTANR